MAKSKSPALKLVSQPQEFFYELVSQALEKQHIRPQPETEFYLVNLLNQFMITERLFVSNGEGEMKSEPLALMLKDALDQTNTEVRRSLLRQVGDVSLYTAGYFQDSLIRKLVDVDYYIGMGGSAYGQVSNLSTEPQQGKVYSELSEKFSKFVDVFAEVSDKTSPKSEKDLLRTYELWVKTGSEKAAKTLQEAGIVPNSTIRKELH
jgi:hypothetical protein